MAKLIGIEPSTVSKIYETFRKLGKKEARRSEGLSCSVLGKPCERELWYGFRWVQDVQILDGRIYRLFETGKREEERIIRDLRRAGIVVSSGPERKKQYRVVDETGHIHGYLDGLCRKVPEAPKAFHILEIKTHNQKNFEKLKSDGVQKGFPVHYAQCQLYMKLGCFQIRGYRETPFAIRRCLYIGVNKNTDEIYSERISFDHDFCEQLLAKAKRIIFSDSPPARISEEPDSWACRFCDYKTFCHQEKETRPLKDAMLPHKNCRTCCFSTPENKDGGWNCEKKGMLLCLKEACDQHLFIPGLIPADPVEADNERITYRDINGDIYVNSAGTGSLEKIA